MTVKCFLVDKTKHVADDNYWDQPGAMFEVDYGDLDGESARNALSEYYYRDNRAKRKPMIVILPNRQAHQLDVKASNAPGWVVTGKPPNLTVEGSILQQGHSGSPGYHGYLTDGVLSDDLEGRTYDVPIVEQEETPDD